MNTSLEDYIGQIEGLPTTQGVLVKLIEFFQQPERDIDDVCKLIHQDPALSAGVLRPPVRRASRTAFNSSLTAATGLVGIAGTS